MVLKNHVPFFLTGLHSLWTHLRQVLNLSNLITSRLRVLQDFLIELDMKPCMHLVEISIFSLNHVIIRFPKIMNNLLEHLKIHTFKVFFLC